MLPLFDHRIPSAADPFYEYMAPGGQSSNLALIPMLILRGSGVALCNCVCITVNVKARVSWHLNRRALSSKIFGVQREAYTNEHRASTSGPFAAYLQETSVGALLEQSSVSF